MAAGGMYFPILKSARNSVNATGATRVTSGDNYPIMLRRLTTSKVRWIQTERGETFIDSLPTPTKIILKDKMAQYLI